jgi:hypothetical protein
MYKEQELIPPEPKGEKIKCWYCGNLSTEIEVTKYCGEDKFICSKCEGTLKVCPICLEFIPEDQIKCCEE